MDTEDRRVSEDITQESDEGSIFTRSELRDRITDIHTHYSGHPAAERMSRRQFLKMIGITAVTSAAFVTGLKHFDRLQPATPTANLTVSGGETEYLEGTHHVGTGGIRVDGELVITGDTRLVYDGVTSPYNHGAIAGNRVNGTIRFENEGDTLIYDQTANSCAVATRLGSGAQFGDNRGEIIFEGEADLTHENFLNAPGSTYVLSPPGSGRAEINRVAWSYGSGAPWRGEHASNIGFSWSAASSDVTFNNCWIWGWSHNLFYWWRHTGRLEFNNCMIEHNGSRGINPPANGLYMTDSTITLGGKNAHQLHSYPGLANLAFNVGGHGGNREVHLDNVHVRRSCTRCDGQQARYCAGGGMIGGWGPQRNGTTLVFYLNDSHKDSSLSFADSDVRIASGSWGSNPRCIDNPIDNPSAYGNGTPGDHDPHIPDEPEEEEPDPIPPWERDLQKPC